MPKVSVIVPVYNVEKYLKECIDSIVSQTLKDIEIICVNDGSTDSSLDILKEYKKNDDRIVIIDKPNSGYGASVNLGISKARSDYIGIVESDDFIRNDMYEILYNIMKENDVDLIKSNWYGIYSSKFKKSYGLIETKLIPEYLCNTVSSVKKDANIINIQSGIWASLYKKSFLEEKGIKFLETPGASYQDTSFCFKVLALADRIYFSDKLLLYYRIDNAQSSVKSNQKVYAICKEYDEIDNVLNKNLDLKKLLFTRKSINQCNSYFWNLKRIHPKFRKDFIKYFSSSFKKILEDPCLDSKYFFENVGIKQIKSIIENPDGFYKVFAIKDFLHRIRKFIFTIHLGKQPSLVIFGIKLI